MRTTAAYLSVGASAALTYVLLSSLLTHYGVTPAVASVASYLICLPIGYLAQRTLTFKSDAPHRSALPRYMAAQLFGIVLAAILPDAMMARLDAPPPVAFAAVAGMIAVTNFLMLRFWAFSSRSGT